MQRPLIAAALLAALAVSFAAVIAQDRDRSEDEAAEQPPAPEQSDRSETPEATPENEDQAPAAPPPPAPAGPRSAEDVLEDLLERRGENPLLEPAQPTEETTGPDAEPRPLRREGQFILTRRGRMIPADTRGSGDASGSASGGASGGGIAAWRFVFESDRSNLQDPPMYLMPCRLLEEMEAVVQRRGDSAVFVLSGQIFAYRGANYLLPTLMKLAPDRGNLQP